MWELIKQFKSKEWQTEHSSLAKKSKMQVSYEQCRRHACEDIVNRLTNPIKNNKSNIIEIPKGTEFHFIGRVDTSRSNNNPDLYYETFEKRNYVSFSTISNKNISHYEGGVFFLYDIVQEDIAHIFPIDSDIKKDAESEEDLTWLPSLWLTLDELEKLKNEFKVYDQITCKTKRNGQIIKPFAVAAFNECDEEIKEIAKRFGIDIVILHPDEDAIVYNKDLLYDCGMLNCIYYKMNKEYGIDVRHLLYLD